MIATIHALQRDETSLPEAQSVRGLTICYPAMKTLSLACAPYRTPIVTVSCLLLLASLQPLKARPGVQPGLSIAAQGGNQVVLNWQDTNSWLQTAPVLTDPFPWVNVNETPTNTVTLGLTQPAQFFRLVLSPVVPPPTELNLQTASDTNADYYFSLNWDSVPGAVSYNLYMASVPGVSSLNYSNLAGGMAFKGITSLFAAVPDVPDGSFSPALASGVPYYFVVTAVSSMGVESADSNPASGFFGPSGGVEGSVFAQVTFSTNTADLDLRNVLLSLRNTNNPAISNSVLSDVNGDFAFPPMPAGNYQLCWQARGFLSACSNNIIISNTDVALDAIQLFPVAGQGFVYGQVTYQDGSPAYDANNLFGIDVEPVVVLMDSTSTVVGSAPVNSSGQYAIGGFTPAASMTVSVTVMGTTASSNINTLVTGEADLVLPDTPPVILSLVATSNGVPVYSVLPGTTVQATVTAIGNNLSYQWFDANGLTSYPPEPSISWTLPTNAVGFQYLWAEVSDGHGGYAEARLELTVNPFVFFSGTVVGSDTGAPLSNAVVQLSTAGTNIVVNTDTNGDFSIEIAIADPYRLGITAPGYAPLNNVFSSETADETYTLMALSPPTMIYCPSGPLPESPGAGGGVTWATNCAGVVVAIPNSGLVNSNNVFYTGCFYVTLDAFDPCDPANNFIGPNLISDGSFLQPYGLVNVAVTDLVGDPLSLAPGYTAQVFFPISPSCVDTNYAQPTNAVTYVPDPGTGEWTPVASASLTTNLVCGTNVVGYISTVNNLGLLCNGVVWGPPPPPAPPPARVNVRVRFLVDDSLNPPLKVGTFYDDGKGHPDPKTDPYINVSYSGQTFTYENILVGSTLWFEVLSGRQGPGYYYGNGGPMIANNQKDVVQALSYPVPATPANPVVVTLGLGQNIDLARSAQLNGLSSDKTVVGNGQQAGRLGNNFLARGVGGINDKFNALVHYYPRVDKPAKKTTFRDWQVANGWDPAKLGTYGGLGRGDDSYGLYFNANDLGAGRRMGMKIYTESDADSKKSVAYYVATYATLADAESDEAAHLQPGDPNSKLKYIVCMEFSLPRDKNNKQAAGTRYIKFFAFTNNVNAQLGLAGVVPDESRARPFQAPYLCLKCHGGGSPELVDDPPEFGDVSGQFVPFDIANYTFSSRGANDPFSPNNPAFLSTFNALNKGLLTSQDVAPTMPANLAILLNFMVSNNKSYTTAAPPKQGGWDWSNDPNDLYNKVYAVSCRSCHVSQTGTRNWATTARFVTGLGRIAGGDPTGDLAGMYYMPHAERTFGIYWGSAAAVQLNTKGIVTQPNVKSQPAIANGVDNTKYFK